MQKPLSAVSEGFAKEKLNSILTQTPTTNQESRISELSSYIRHHQLTNALEYLEQCGFSNDVAIFMLALLHWGTA
jgi:hypothetical protein